MAFDVVDCLAVHPYVSWPEPNTEG
jgi:hypothetical protein